MTAGRLLKDTFRTWMKRAPRPVFAAAIFFAIGSVMQMTGYDMATQSFQMPSMISTLANVSAAAFQGSYQFIAPWIGLLGGFITGSEASTIAMFGTYVLESAGQMDYSLKQMLLVAAALAFGGGLASVISPAKLQNAAASIDKIGQEHLVIRTAFVFAIILTTVTALFAGLFLAIGLIQ
jgi:lactate permease